MYRNEILNKRYTHLQTLLAEKKDPEIFWLVRDLEARKMISGLKDDNGTMRHEHGEMGEVIAKQLSSDSVVPYKADIVVNIPLTLEDLSRALHESSGNMASGRDDISYPLLRFWFKHEPEHMMSVVRNLVANGCPQWQCARTVLMTKVDKQSYDVAKSWRMVHLLPTMAKVIDRMMLIQISKEMKLGPTQFGSRKGHSCHDSFKITREFAKFHNFSNTRIMTMDVKGGFNNINTDMLLDIMMADSLNHEILMWVKRWLSGRSMELKFNGQISKVFNIDKGVPQGSPISPYLFGVYVRDLFKPRLKYIPGISSLMCSYVDDGTIMVAGSSLRTMVSRITEMFEDANRIAMA